MALDTALKRASALNIGCPWRGILPPPDGSVEAVDKRFVGFLYAGNVGAQPVQVDQIPNLSATFDSGTHEFDLSVYFLGQQTYAIDPAVETGWTFDTDTGLLTIDTDDEGTFGPYTVTASNGSGDAVSNAFTVKVSTSSVRAYRGLGGIGLLRYIK